MSEIDVKKLEQIHASNNERMKNHIIVLVSRF